MIVVRLQDAQGQHITSIGLVEYLRQILSVMACYNAISMCFNVKCTKGANPRNIEAPSDRFDYMRVCLKVALEALEGPREPR
jgi:hypothetical protein